MNQGVGFGLAARMAEDTGPYQRPEGHPLQKRIGYRGKFIAVKYRMDSMYVTSATTLLALIQVTFSWARKKKTWLIVRVRAG
jgi:hypothetical protein